MKRTLLAYLFITSIFTSVSQAEFRVNTRTTNNQADAAIAIDANENFVVVWNSYGQDGSSNGIFGQRFGSNCNPMCDEFQINTTTSGNQKEPSVAIDGMGNFAVAWQSKDGNDWDIFAQRFDSNGQHLDDEFRVNTYTDSEQRFPRVAMNNDGNFVVVWESEKLGAEPYAWVICCQLYDASGLAVGEEFEVNLLLQCRYPDVAMDGNGNFTIVWMQDDIFHTSNVVMARQYDADGTPKTDEPFEVSTSGFSTIPYPSIGMNVSGHFVVAWDGHPDGASYDDIHARRYKFDGTPLSAEFMVNTTPAGAQQRPSVVMNNQREFVIVWNSKIDPNVNERDILGQRYDSLYKRLGDEFRINTYVVGDQKYPAVAMKESGEFVAVWQSDGQDGSGYGIFGEFGPKIYCADFSGDLFVNFRDYCILAAEWLKEENPLKADLLDDNSIDEFDLAHFCEQWLTPCYECNKVDINSDGKIDFKDYGFWANNWLQQGANFDGDITGNGIVDMADLKALVFHWAQTCK